MDKILSLVWKEFTVRRRSWKIVFFNIICPLLLFTFLGFFRFLSQNSTQHSTESNERYLDGGTVNVYIYSGDKMLNEILTMTRTELEKTNDMMDVWTACNDSYLWNLEESFENLNINITEATSEKHVERLLQSQRINSGMANLTSSGQPESEKSVTFGVFLRNEEHEITEESKNIVYHMQYFGLSYEEVLLSVIHEKLLLRFYMFQANRTNLTNTTYALQYKASHLKTGDETVFFKTYSWTWTFGPAFLFPLCVLASQILFEKETKMKELLRIFDVQLWQYYLSYFLLEYAILMMVILLYVLLFMETDKEDSLSYLLILQLFLVSSILYSMSLTVFFENPTTGVTILVVTYANSCMAVPNGTIAKSSSGYKIDRDSKDWVNILLCVFCPPPYAFGMFLKLLQERRIIDNQASISNYFGATKYQSALFTPGMVMLALMCAILIYLFVLFYVGEVWPWQSAVPKPLNFPFRKLQRKRPQEAQEDGAGFFFEQVPPDLSIGIEIINVNKRIGRKGDVLKNISLNLYFGQIAILLGQNGAGKTTLFNVLTGLAPVTKGTVFINGCDVDVNLAGARRHLGICPQTDVMFDKLTVIEHLQLFGFLKGHKGDLLQKEILRVLKVLRLMKERHLKPRQLRHSSKRLLQLAMALIARSKILILDEPTSGLDVDAKKTIWDILFSLKKDSLILLTTHSMDEAEWLGDRVAVMHRGCIRCCGSTMFMKRMFGHGYYLMIYKSQGFDVKKCMQLVSKHFKSGKLVRQSKIEIVVNFEEAESAQLADFFTDLDTNRTVLAIRSCTARKTTLDDVAVQIASMFHTENEPEEDPEVSVLPIEIQQTCWKSFRAILCKRFRTTSRSQLLYVLFLFNCLSSVFYCVLMPTVFVFMSKKFDNISLTNMVTATCTGSICKSYEDIANASNVILESAASSNSTLSINQNRESNCIYVHSYANESNLTSLTFAYNGLLRSLSGPQAETYSELSVTYNAKKLQNLHSVKDTFIKLFIFMVFQLCLHYLPIYRNIIRERVSGMKLLQLMTGLSPLTYWFSHMVFDVCHTLLLLSPILLVELICRAFINVEIFTYNVYSVMVTLFCLFISAIYFVSAAYTQTWLTNNVTGGLIFFGVFNLVCTLLSAVILSYDRFFYLDRPKDFGQFISAFILWTSLLSPLHLLYQLLQQVFQNTVRNRYCDILLKEELEACSLNNFHDIETNKEFFTLCCGDLRKSVILALVKSKDFRFFCIVTVIMSIVFTLLNLIIESKSYIWELSTDKVYHWYIGNPPSISLKTQDKNVVEEEVKARKLVEKSEYKNKALVVEELSKSFRGHFAIEKISFVVEQKECFGLLGVNRSGKTMTFKILVGDLRKTTGEVYIRHLSMSKNFREYRKQIGYCPEDNVLFHKLTAREALTLFARLRGVKSNALTQTVENMIKCVNLEAHANNTVEGYSAGNQRKLSIGIALIGWPKLILLDEPTVAVDPVARRRIWKLLDALRNTQPCTLVLTSHSMDECENLCDRIAFMVAGKFAFVGTIQQLKERSRLGYTVLLKPRIGIVDVDNITSDMKRLLPSASRRDNYTTVIEFYVADTTVTKSYIYRAIEQIKTDYQLEDYEVREPTLEQILQTFARIASQNVFISQ